MEKIILYFLPMILLLGVLTSYSDIKEGKIRNKWVVLALVYASVVYFMLISFYYIPTGMNKHYLIELFTNILFAIGLGFGLWYFGIWTAGDGKLFIAFSALIPLSVYSVGYQKWIPSIMLLINIFVAALLIMLALMLFKIKMKNVNKVLKVLLKELFTPKQLLNSIIYLFAIYWIVQALLNLMGLDSNYLLRFILTLLVFSSIQKKLKNKAFYIMIVISLVRLIIDKSVYSLSFLVDFLMLVLTWRLIMSFLRGGISKLGQEIFAKDIKVDKLKPGMILSEVIQKKDKLSKKEIDTFKKMPDIKIMRYKGDYYIKKPKSALELNNFIEEEAEGLTREQINKIKGIGIKKIKVSQTIPFAPFIFLGVVLTILAKGNILIVIKNIVF